MSYLLGLLLGIMVLSTVALADIMVPSVFTQEFARALAKAMPLASVKVTGDMQVTVKAASGREWGVFLGNTYQDYKRDPSLFDEIVQAYAARLTPAPAAQSELDRARIVPVIKDRKWLADLHSSLKAKGVEQEHLSERFNNELVIVYAQDDPDRMRYLTTGEGAGIPREELKALAVNNLKRLLPKIEMRRIGDVMLMSAGGDYEASLLLIDDIWSGGQIKVDGDVVVAVPARDVLLVTGSRNRTALKSIRELAAKYVAEGRYELTDTLFVYRDGRFSKFGR
jgi:uncharacterized protein YtpQ (UPF0354 family)